MKTVFTVFSTSHIHEGHLNIINKAAELGELTVGILTDEAAVKFDRFPLASQEERMEMVRAIPGVAHVIYQDKPFYDETIARLRPDYVVHGDNWCTGYLKALRDNAEKAVSAYGGQIVDIPFTYSEEAWRVSRRERGSLALPDHRRARLRKLLSLRSIVKAIEVTSGLTGLIAEKTIVNRGEELDQFDAMWISSLCDSTAKGKPDIELVDLTSRLETIEEVCEVTTKPIIFDGDTGGLTEHFVYTVRTLERLGVSAVIIEDKIGLKKNSLFGTEVEQTQDTIEHFCEKISEGKRVQLSDDFMIVARIESLILEQGIEDALERAHAYVGAGADAVMIHSRQKSPDEIFEFCDRFRADDAATPIVVVPTSYNQVTEEELAEHGVNIVIYANQLTRSAFPAMEATAREILVNHRAKEADSHLMSIKDIITLIDGL